MSKIRSVYEKREPYEGLLFVEPTMTQQQFAVECDINDIVKRAMQTGDFSAFAATDGDFIDVSDLGDYADAVNFINTVNDEFMTLPAELRANFDNDAGKYIDFVGNPDNLDECIKLGILSGGEPDFNPVQTTDTPAVASKAESNSGAEDGTVST